VFCGSQTILVHRKIGSFRKPRSDSDYRTAFEAGKPYRHDPGHHIYEAVDVARLLQFLEEAHTERPGAGVQNVIDLLIANRKDLVGSRWIPKGMTGATDV
jgi:hypothetical protein